MDIDAAYRCSHASLRVIVSTDESEKWKRQKATQRINQVATQTSQLPVSFFPFLRVDAWGKLSFKVLERRIKKDNLFLPCLKFYRRGPITFFSVTFISHSLWLSLSDSVSVSVSLCLSVSLSVCLSVSLSLSPLSVSVSLSLFLSLSVYKVSHEALWDVLQKLHIPK